MVSPIAPVIPPVNSDATPPVIVASVAALLAALAALARAGHEPTVLLRNCAKWTRKADAKIAETIGRLSKNMV